MHASFYLLTFALKRLRESKFRKMQRCLQVRCGTLCIFFPTPGLEAKILQVRCKTLCIFPKFGVPNPIRTATISHAAPTVSPGHGRIFQSSLRSGLLSSLQLTSHLITLSLVDIVVHILSAPPLNKHLGKVVRGGDKQYRSYRQGNALL